MKKRLRLVGILIVVIVLIGGGWVVWQRRSEEAKRQEAIAEVEALKKTLDAEPETDKVKLYMIAGGGNGKDAGCGATLSEVTRTFPETDYLTGAYEELLSLKDAVYTGTEFRNPLAKSSLKVVSATMSEEGVAKIVLNGTLATTDECDKLQVIAQLKEPALHFWGVKAVELHINGQPL